MTNNVGLAARARKLVIGTESTLLALRKGRLSLILLASDASGLTKKNIHDKAKHYQVDVLEHYSASELSHAIGRHDIKVIGVTDQGFANLLMQPKRK